MPVQRGFGKNVPISKRRGNSQQASAVSFGRVLGRVPCRNEALIIGSRSGSEDNDAEFEPRQQKILEAVHLESPSQKRRVLSKLRFGLYVSAVAALKLEYLH